jgi:hypothetical protein
MGLAGPIFCLLLFMIAPPPAPGEGWLAFGDLRGHLAPCGCDPKTDLGGIGRLGSLLEQETPPLLLFNLGNNLSGKTPLTLEDQFILKGLALLKPSVSLRNRREIEEKSLSPKDYVLSNQKPPFVLGVPFWVSDKVQVWGGVFSTDLSFLEPLSEELIKRWKKEALPDRERFLLFSGSDDDLKKITKYGFFQNIISSNSKDFEIFIGEKETDLERLPGVYMTPLGGGGMLRGGWLAKTPGPPTLETLLLPNTTGPGFLEPFYPVTWLKPSYEPSQGSRFRELFDQYRVHSQKDFHKAAAARGQDLADSPYVGALSCQGCHPQAYDTWQKSKHAQAFVTLEGVRQGENPACVGCHSVGYEKKGGFASKALSPHLSHVQCENCHGPRKEHIKSPAALAKPPSAMGVCVSCHIPPHSPSFHLETYWKEIAHGVP